MGLVLFGKMMIDQGSFSDDGLMMMMMMMNANRSSGVRDQTRPVINRA
jgi:hypothetical protein